MTDQSTVSYVHKIVEVFGGVRKMARALGKPTSTVASWVTRGSIRDDEKPAVLQAAQALGLALTRDDFFPLTQLDRREAADQPPTEDAA